jgi:hypothetical protein
VTREDVALRRGEFGPDVADEPGKLEPVDLARRCLDGVREALDRIGDAAQPAPDRALGLAREIERRLVDRPELGLVDRDAARALRQSSLQGEKSGVLE